VTALSDQQLSLRDGSSVLAEADVQCDPDQSFCCRDVLTDVLTGAIFVVRSGTYGDGQEAPREPHSDDARVTLVDVTTEPLETVRDHLSVIVDRVEHQHERVVITRNGHAAAVLISPEDLAQLEETVSVLADPQALAEIREAHAAYAAGDVVRGVDAGRRPQR
jgi:antitoxin YefM